MHVGHGMGLEHDLGLGVGPSYKPCWDHITEDSGRVFLQDNSGKKVVIEEVLYVPRLKTNLLSLRQLLQKGFTMQIEENYLSVFDQTGA